MRGLLKTYLSFSASWTRTNRFMSCTCKHFSHINPVSASLDNYENAVVALNGLQSNAAVLAAAAGGSTDRRSQKDKMDHVNVALEALGIQPGDLNRLKAVHIAGTKGKGSTAALCESILRQHSLKTGFFSSPHLVEVRERIRLNGDPISKDMFAYYFWKTYNRLTSNLGSESLPPYFMFLTLMAFQVFLEQTVDVAVIEVGIGGRFDTTNVIPRPVVCGVTSLGIDHVAILGDTIEQIAWQKAGIFKPGVPAVTVEQIDSAQQVLIDYAEEVECPLYQAPRFDERSVRDFLPTLGLEGNVQFLNASLAVQLCKIFLERRRCDTLYTTPTHGPTMLPLANIASPQFRTGLNTCRWAGRFQKLEFNNCRLYLDGAHTRDSMAASFQWYRSSVLLETQATKDAQQSRILIFNKTGTRDATVLLEEMIDPEFPFDYVVFCSNLIGSKKLGDNLTKKLGSADSDDRRTLPSEKLQALLDHKDKWTEILSTKDAATQRAFTSCKVVTFPSITHVVEWLEGLNSELRAQVLITGSLYLVGNFLSVIHDSYCIPVL